jgi:hypothetical protein
MGTFLFALQWTVCCAGSAFTLILCLFTGTAAGTWTFSHPHDTNGGNNHCKDNEQHYDGRQVHAMTALAMR